MDIYEEVTCRIVEQMEQGEIPWRKPWIAGGSCVSYATGKPYSLLNQMLLGQPGEYLTFRQCRQAGGHIHRGEKAHMVVFWKWIEQKNEETGEKKEIPFLRYYRVFHINKLPKRG
ncbi:MAG: ArdC family protein [Candidatus Faecivicinus sp.]|nr:ArdC family protein [Candidatus Faecivicinus sp.]